MPVRFFEDALSTPDKTRAVADVPTEAEKTVKTKMQAAIRSAKRVVKAEEARVAAFWVAV